jgi:general secretion pathway protein D
VRRSGGAGTNCLVGSKDAPLRAVSGWSALCRLIPLFGAIGLASAAIAQTPPDDRNQTLWRPSGSSTKPASASDSPPAAAAPAIPDPTPTPNPVQEKLPPPRRKTAEEPFTMHMDEVDVRKALEILSRDGGLNIMVSPGVSGKVTANLAGLSPEQTLDAILRLCNLVAQRDRGVIYVYSAEESKKAGPKDGGPVIRVYRLNYIRATDVEKMIKPLLTPSKGKLTTSPTSEMGGVRGSSASSGGSPGAGGAPGGGGGAPGGGGSPGGGAGGGATGGGGSGGNLMAGGEVVIVQDEEPILREIDQLISQLDVPPPQVLIEAVILTVTLNKDQEFGVNFGVVDAARSLLGVVGNGATLNTTLGFGPSKVLSAGGQVAGNTNTGFAADEHGLKFGFIDNNVQGFLRALQTIGRLEVLATPRLLVLNKQLAELQLGQLLGYTTFSQSQVSTVQAVQFLPVGTLLRVRPFISSDGMVRMEVHPERSSGQVINNIPQTDTTEVTTNVMVPDGATIVIGGLMENVDNKQEASLPVLGDLPWLGFLFRQRQHTHLKRELVVLLTPRIWNPRGPYDTGLPSAESSLPMPRSAIPPVNPGPPFGAANR